MSSYPRNMSMALKTAAAFIAGLAMHRYCNVLSVICPLQLKVRPSYYIDDETAKTFRLGATTSVLEDQVNDKPVRNAAVTAPKRATAVLIRTGTNECAYASLLRRNAAIARRAWAASVDHLVFHDGSLPPAHAEYIRAHSPGLIRENEANNLTTGSSLQFVSAQPTFDEARRAMLKAKSNKYCKPTPISKRYFMGYKAMCWFWFKEVLNYSEVLRYNEILRIDDDCYLSDLEATSDKSNDFWPSFYPEMMKTDPAFLSGNEASSKAHMDSISPLASVADAGMDNRATTLGMHQAFAELNGSVFAPVWRMPYSNVMLYNVTYLSQSAALAQVT